METFRAISCVSIVFASLLNYWGFYVNGQGIIGTPCTSSMVTSFTPCLSFITGSTRNGGSPTAACCDSLRALTTSGVDCACLIITGNVPFSLPINRTLAISLPGACQSSSVPIQCKASGVPLPAPGPALFVPPPPPTTAPSHSPSNSPSPRASKATASFSPTISPAAGTTNISPASSPSKTTSNITPSGSDSPAKAPPTTAGIRPVLTPTSASNPSYNNVSPFLLLALLATISLYNN